MTTEEAKEYAKHMTYSDAVQNALKAKCVPYRKATLMKLHELLDIIEYREAVKLSNTRRRLLLAKAESLKAYCLEQADCDECIFHLNGECIFGDYPLEWCITTLKEANT